MAKKKSKPKKFPATLYVQRIEDEGDDSEWYQPSESERDAYNENLADTDEGQIVAVYNLVEVRRLMSLDPPYRSSVVKQ